MSHKPVYEVLKVGDVQAFHKMFAQLTKDRMGAVAKSLEEVVQALARDELQLEDLDTRKRTIQTP